MRKPITLTVGFIIGLLLTSCNYKENSERASLEPLPKAELAIIDSILLEPDSIPYWNYCLDSYRKGYFISIDQNDEVYLLQSDGKLLTKISKKGKGPGEYLLPVGIKSFSSDSIFVSDYHSGKVLHFNKDGKFVESWEVVKNDKQNTFTIYYNYLNVVKDNKNQLTFEYVGRSDKANNITTPNYYKEARLLSIYTPKLNKYKHYVPFEEGSPYLGDEYFLSPLDPRIFKLPNQNYAVVFPHEDCIYLYDTTGELIRRIDGRSSFFPLAKGVSFKQRDSQFGVDYVKFNIKQNALNYPTLNSFVGKNSDIVIAKQYEAPVKDETLPNDLNTLKFTYYKRDSYLQFYNTEGDKLFEDIKQPYRLRHLVYADSFDFLIFKADPKLTEKNILYVAKLVP